MNLLLNLDDRLRAQEHRQFNSEVRIEEMARDMTTGIKQVTEYLGKIENQTNARFDKVDQRLDKMDARFDKIDERLDKTETDIADMKADIAVMKGDITTMQGDIVIMKGDIVTMKGDISDIKSTMAKSHQETVQVLLQILERLP